MFLKLQRETHKKEDNMNLRKKRIMVVIVMAIVLSSVQNTRIFHELGQNSIPLHMKVEKVMNNWKEGRRIILKKKTIEKWIYIIMLKEEM